MSLGGSVGPASQVWGVLGGWVSHAAACASCAAGWPVSHTRQVGCSGFASDVALVSGHAQWTDDSRLMPLMPSDWHAPLLPAVRVVQKSRGMASKMGHLATNA